MTLRCLRPLSLLLLTTFATTLAAQNVVLAPSMAATGDGNTGLFSIFYAGGTAPRAHTQILLATSDLPSGTGNIQALTFRPVNSVGGGPAFTAHLRIEMSMSPVVHTAALATFALNPGANPIVVLDGTISMPAVPASPSFPPPPMAMIPFTTPFPYDSTQGNSLVIDITTTNVNTGSSYQVAGVTAGGGTWSGIYSSGACRTTNGTFSGTWGGLTLGAYPGGPFLFGLNGYPTNRASFASSILMFDFSQTGTFGGYTLPVALTTLGLPANVSCMLAVSPDVSVPIAYVPGQNGGSSGSLRFGPVTLPAIPSLGGMQFSTQALSVDYDNSMPGPLLFPSLAVRWTMGTGNLPAGSMVTRMADTVPANATGGVQANQAPVVFLLF